METPIKISTEKISRTPHTPKTTSLNEHLNTDFINIGEDDTSASAQVTRIITSCVGRIVTPRKLLVLLRVLKAVTFCFLILTLCADLMYIIFLEVAGRSEVKELAGGRRDTILRLYGLVLAVVAICIELDYSAVVKSFYGFKGFIPRSFLLFFVSVITGAHPLHAQETNYDGDDDDDYFDETAFIESQIPHSAINFQMVTSFVLGSCAVTYFVFGCLCLDRFTSRAFLSTNDPLVSTAILTPTANSSEKIGADPGVGTYLSPQEH